MNFSHFYLFAQKMGFDVGFSGRIGVETLKRNIPIVALHRCNSFKTRGGSSADDRNNVFLLPLDKNPIVLIFASFFAASA